MNILYVSHLSGAPYAGPTYSVPAQIRAQAEIDNVFWYNAVKYKIEGWKSYSYYHDLSEFPTESIGDLPAPFNNPELVIVEQFYNMVRSRLLKELLKKEIPYIIIPRGELTKQAQKRKKMKKILANCLICKRFAKNAQAIQYLTSQEYLDSGDGWNANYFISPNGIYMPTKRKIKFSSSGIKCVYIGRIEPYQKGIDILISACERIRDELRSVGFKIKLYGPDKEKKLVDLQKDVEEKALTDIISFHDSVFGSAKEKILLESDIFLLASRFEGHPMALIEALSYGIPCIVTKGTNMKSEVEEFNAGWTADNNELSLANALTKAIKEFKRDTLSEYSANASSLARKYDWDLLARENTNKYIQLTNEQGQ